MLVKDAEDNSRVGHARDLDVVEIVIDSEPLFKCKYQRVDARAARMDQRAVDVEKQQALCSRCCPERSRANPGEPCPILPRDSGALKALVRASLAPQ